MPFSTDRTWALMSPSTVHKVIWVSSVIAPQASVGRDVAGHPSGTVEAADFVQVQELDARSQRIADRPSEQAATHPVPEGQCNPLGVVHDPIMPVAADS